MASSSRPESNYPLSAFAGNELGKSAVLCLLVNPSIKSLLITGAPGTGKSVLSRSVASIIPDAPLVNIPAGASEDRIFGSVNFEKAVSTGEIVADKGLLQEADHGVVCVDDVDLMEKRLALETLESASRGEVAVEREGLSCRYSCDVSVIATTVQPLRRMDPHILDRFDMCVRTDVLALELRAESLRNTLLFQDGDEEFIEAHRASDDELGRQVSEARRRLPGVTVLKKHRDAIARVCRQYGVASYRGAVACAQVAATLAALGRRSRTCDEDIVRAAEMCLAHRRTIFEEKRRAKQDYEVFIYSNDYDMRYFIHDDRGMNNTVKLTETMNLRNEEPDDGKTIGLDGALDIETEVGRKLRTIDIMESADHHGESADTRFKRYVESPSGRYSGFRIPVGRCRDVALDATLRAAAVNQFGRTRDDGRLKVENQDLREKIRTKHVEQTFLFLMDTSGSLLIRGRFGKVKAAIISMLESHYVKRDRVGLMTFDGEKMDVVLSPTRSTEQLSHTIDGIRAGRETPLSEALVRCWEFTGGYRRKHPEEMIHIVLFTDGRATIPLSEGNDPCDEALDIASNLSAPRVDWIVIDTGLDYTRSDMAERLAETLKGRYFMLDEVESKETVNGMWKPHEVEIYTKKIHFER